MHHDVVPLEEPQRQLLLRRIAGTCTTADHPPSNSGIETAA